MKNDEKCKLKTGVVSSRGLKKFCSSSLLREAQILKTKQSNELQIGMLFRECIYFQTRDEYLCKQNPH